MSRGWPQNTSELNWRSQNQRHFSSVAELERPRRGAAFNFNGNQVPRNSLFLNLFSSVTMRPLDCLSEVRGAKVSNSSTWSTNRKRKTVNHTSETSSSYYSTTMQSWVLPFNNTFLQLKLENLLVQEQLNRKTRLRWQSHPSVTQRSTSLN